MARTASRSRVGFGSPLEDAALRRGYIRVSSALRSHLTCTEANSI
jgi:hypothetical protein